VSELRIVVPAVPPSGNHYKKYRVIRSRTGESFVQWYHTDLAEKWWALVDRAAGGRQLISESYEVHFIVYRETLRNTDVDNYSKCIFDALTKAHVISDDRYVDDFHGHRRLDRANPRTVILVRAAQVQMFESEA